jgi:acyl-coenzyme A thioesterase PaaI-like protein
MEEKAFQDIWPEWGSNCWGCGRSNEHGLQIKSYWEGDEAVCTWQPKKYHEAYMGALCGGIIATIIDCHCTNTAIAAAYKAATGKELGSEPFELDSESILRYATGSMNIRLIRPARTRKPVVLRAKVKEMKKSKITVSCSLFYNNKLCATGEVIVINLDR